MVYEEADIHCVPFILKNLHLHRLKYSSSGRAAPPLFVGVNGMQSVGKTTLVSTLSKKLSSLPYLVRTLALSIDDLYLPRAQQALLASLHSTNPLIQQRGQASTHDLPLALGLISSLIAGERSIIPSYDKSAHAGKGDRVPEGEWKNVEPGEVEVVLFEGWCIGFRALDADELMRKWKEAVAQRGTDLYKGRLGWNRFEDVEFVNDAWRGYEELWSKLDILIHIHAEDPHYVYEWRLEQEASLRKTKDAGMTDEQVIEFVNGYYPSYELYTDPLRFGLFPREKGRQLELLVGKNRKVKQAMEVGAGGGTGEERRSKQVFHSTNLSIALVNLKPLLPGHVLVIPRRVTPRLSDLSHPELSDLFLTVQRVGRMVERVYEASSLNIALQDGPEAGQSVPHVHAHIIPRKRLDLEARGGGDAIYGMLEGEEGDVGAHLREVGNRPKFPIVEESSRNARSEEDMAKEARMLTEEMEKTI